MTDPLVGTDGEPTPLGSAILELVHSHGWVFRRAALHVLDRFNNDMSCPVSGMYDEEAVRSHYREHGLSVNVVPLVPLRAHAG